MNTIIMVFNRFRSHLSDMSDIRNIGSMKFFIFLLNLIFLAVIETYAEDLNELLKIYKKESDLSRITKREAAGNLTLYTRDDLERMQAHMLIDVLRTVPGFHVYRGINGLTLMSPPTYGAIPPTTIRLYINDHDMTSSSFGSAMLIWGEMPIEYVDHIEVYKTSSSIDFGNESGVLVIRVYTKQALRDNGSKARVMADQKGSFELNLYNSEVFDNDFSYFVFANADDYKRERYYNEFEGKKYAFKNDRHGYNLYGNIQYKKSKFEIGKLYKKSGSFLGIGKHKTPTDGNLHAYHFYTHFTQEFENDIKLQLSYDAMNYERSYVDPNGISIADPSSQSGRRSVSNYDIEFKDEVYGAIIEKRVRYEKNSITLGAFYKYKKMEEEGRFDSLQTPQTGNGYDLYSIYAEEGYDFDEKTRFILMAKGDFYRYKKEVDSADELVARVGITKDIDRFRFKLFYTDTYLPNSFYSIFNPSRTPYVANPHLKHAQIKIGSFSATYGQEKWDVKFFMSHHSMKDGVIYRGKFQNSDKTAKFYRYELSGHYYFNPFNTLFCSLFTGTNDKDLLRSPKYGASFRLDDTFGKVDLYNELRYTSSYTDSFYNIYVPYTLDWTLAAKYHVTKDFSAGVRGENLLDRSYYVVYRGYSKPIQSYDRKIWINLEYLF